MPKQNLSPLEYDECVVFADWLTLKGFKFSHLAQETFTKSWKTKTKNKLMGVNSGIPDYIILLPNSQGIVFVEMKRQQGGKTSPAQTEWIEALNAIPYCDARVCKGAQAAMDYLSEFGV